MRSGVHALIVVYSAILSNKFGKPHIATSRAYKEKNCKLWVSGIAGVNEGKKPRNGHFCN